MQRLFNLVKPRYTVLSLPKDNVTVNKSLNCRMFTFSKICEILFIKCAIGVSSAFHHYITYTIRMPFLRYRLWFSLYTIVFNLILIFFSSLCFLISLYNLHIYLNIYLENLTPVTKLCCSRIYFKIYSRHLYFFNRVNERIKRNFRIIRSKIKC